jgi:hypothetical protein
MPRVRRVQQARREPLQGLPDETQEALGMSVGPDEEYIEELQGEIERLESLVAEYKRITAELVVTRPETPTVVAIRLAARVPLLWGRGDYSLGYSISQHILSLIDEHDPDWGFSVLPKHEIERLIRERDYAPYAYRFNPRPRPLRMLWIWLRGFWQRGR